MPPMMRPLPHFFSRYHRIGGVLHLGLFDDCPETEKSFHEAIVASIGESAGEGTVDRRRLVGLPWRSLSPQAFLGAGRTSRPGRSGGSANIRRRAGVG